MDLKNLNQLEYAAGIATGIYHRDSLFDGSDRIKFAPAMAKEVREKKYRGWQEAVAHAMSDSK